MPKTEFQQTAKSAGMIGLTAFAGALVGFALQLIVAYYFGADNETDAYFMAQSTSELLTKLLMGGSIASVFIPIFVKTLTSSGKEDAFKLALNILHVIALVFLILIIVVGLFAEPFVAFIAPGFDAATQDLTVKILRILLPSFFFLFLVDLGTSMLHALKKFAVPAFLRVIAPTTSIIIILLFVKSIGIYALALGAVVGSVLQFSFILQGLVREGFRYHLIFNPFDNTLKRLMFLVYPFIFSMLVTQGAGLVYRVLVSDLQTGSLASLKFAEKISQLMAIMFLTSVTSVIYPVLAEKASLKDMDGMRSTIASAIRLIVFVTLPLVIGIALLREPLISFLFERGSFSADDASQTSIALLYLIIGLITNGISAVLGYTVLALQETRASVAITVASQAIAISLFVLLVPVMGHAGLALGSTLVPLASGLLYFMYLTRYVPRLGSIFYHATYVKIGILGALVAVAVLVLMPVTQSISAPHNISLLLQLVIPALVGGVIFLSGAQLLGIPEMRELMTLLTNKVMKWTRKESLQV